MILIIDTDNPPVQISYGIAIGLIRHERCRAGDPLKEIAKGKAKTVYEYDDEHYLIEFRDDITAFDSVKHDVVGGKGYYNCQISARLFELLENNGIKTHFVRLLGPNKMLVKKVKIVPLEVIVRNIAAGSITRNYPVKEGTVFDRPIVMLDYKDDSYHDPLLNDDIALAMGIATIEELNEIRGIALRVNDVLRGYFESIGILLPDFKIELGKDSAGNLLVADEISPDSCRLWDAETKRSLDKDNYRFEKGDVLAGYKEVYRRMFGEVPEDRKD